MSISGLSSDTTISQAKFYLDEVRKIAGEASSTPTAMASTSTVTEAKGTAQMGTATAAPEGDSYNVYIKSDLSNVVGYAPGSTATTQAAFSIPSANQSNPSPADGGKASTTLGLGSTGSAPSLPLQFESSNASQGTQAAQAGSSQTTPSQTASSTQNSGTTQDNTSVQDGDSDDLKAYSVLVNDLTMLASLIQSGDMPNAKTTAGTVIKDLNNYLSAPSQKEASANPPAPKFVAQNFGSLLASVQEGDKASASTIVSAIKVLS